MREPTVTMSSKKANGKQRVPSGQPCCGKSPTRCAAVVRCVRDVTLPGTVVSSIALAQGDASEKWILLSTVNSSIPSMPRVRPSPEFFTPPLGNSGVFLL